MNSLTVLVLLLFTAAVALALTVWSALAVGRKRRAEPEDEPYEARGTARARETRSREPVVTPVAKRTVVSPPRIVVEPRSSQPPIDFADPPTERVGAARGPTGSARGEVGAARYGVGSAHDQAGSARDQVGPARDQVGARGSRAPSPPPMDPPLPTEIRPGRSGRAVREPVADAAVPAAGEQDRKPGGVSVRPRVVVTESEPPRAPQRPEPDAPRTPQTNETPRATVKPREVEPNAFDRFIDAERRRS